MSGAARHSDKPKTTLSVPADPDLVSSFVNIRVAGIQACYELWKSRGAEFITEPIRNDIEHKDASPPSIDRCVELADVTWYFLKTTDYACKTVPLTVLLRCVSGASSRKPELWLDVMLDNPPPPLEAWRVSGWLTAAEISDAKSPNSQSIRVSEILSKTAFRPTSNSSEVETAFLKEEIGGRGDDERFFKGRLEVSPSDRQQILRLSLSSL
jgi:hypothetical protein